jgi:hypothetical protein
VSSKNSLPKRLTLMALVGSTVMMSGTQKAEAWPGWREQFLGYANMSDNARFNRNGNSGIPWDQAGLCRTKFRVNDAQGRRASLFSLDTYCYRSYWSWW